MCIIRRDLLQRTFQRADRRLQGVISRGMILEILAKLDLIIPIELLKQILE